MNKVVLITGTSSGIGRAAAETLAKHRYQVIATMRDSSGKNRPAATYLISLAEREGYDLQVLEMDVTSDASVNRAVEQALRRFGRIDVVINNAGIAGVGITEGFTIGQFQQVLDVNLLGPIRVNRAVLPAMRRQQSGLLIHVSSAAGRAVLPGFAAYSASKFALEAVADVYRFELSAFGIDSVIVEPGIHKTALTERSFGPAEEDRVSFYGPVSEAVNRIKGILENAVSAPETPGPEIVAESFISLIETPAGKRPFRTVPSTSMQPLLEDYNAATASVRDTVAELFGVSELTAIRQGGL